MKITKSQLRKIIKEELKRVTRLREYYDLGNADEPSDPNSIPFRLGLFTGTATANGTSGFEDLPYDHKEKTGKDLFRNENELSDFNSGDAFGSGEDENGDEIKHSYPIPSLAEFKELYHKQRKLTAQAAPRQSSALDFLDTGHDDGMSQAPNGRSPRDEAVEAWDHFIGTTVLSPQERQEFMMALRNHGK